MPAYEVTFKVSTEKGKKKERRLVVTAPTLDDAVEEIANRKPDSEITGAYLIGKFISVTEPESDNENEATWVSKDGNVRKISAMKTGNLRAILKKLEAPNADDFKSLSEVVRDEIAVRE